MSFRFAALVVSFVVLSVGCGARPDLLESEEYGGEGGGGSAGSAGTGGTGTSGAAGSVAGAAGSPQGGAAGAAGTGPAGAAGSPQGGAAGSPQGGAAGSSQGGAAGAAGSSGTICPGFGDQCTGCLSTACPERYCNCYDNKECFALLQCADPCNGNQDCVQMCYAAHQGGIADAALLTDCAGTLCPAACPGNGGGTVDPCGTCILTTCEKEANACLAQPECLLLYNCLSDCPQLDLMCQQGCYDQHGAGVPALQAMLNCASSQCPDTCN